MTIRQESPARHASPSWVTTALALFTVTCGGGKDAPPRELYFPAAVTPAFYADRCVVSWSEYLRCVSAGACQLGDDTSEGVFEPRHQAVVTFDEARAYCASVGKRLPTTREFLLMTEGPAEPDGCSSEPGCCSKMVSDSGVYERYGRQWVELRNARYPHGAQMTRVFDGDPEILNRMPSRWPWGLDPREVPPLAYLVHAEPDPVRGGVFRCVRTAPTRRP